MSARQMVACAGKASFASRALALSTARSSNRRHEGARLQPYRCPHCGTWHVGNGKRLARRIEPASTEC